MIAGSVDEETSFIPSAGFDSGALVQAAQDVQLLVADGQRVLGQQRQVLHVRRPHHVPTFRNLN